VTNLIQPCQPIPETIRTGAPRLSAYHFQCGSQWIYVTYPDLNRRRRRVTKVTFTPTCGGPSIHLVVWQFWGRAAEAS